MDNQATNSNVAFWGCLISMLVVDSLWGKVFFSMLMAVQFVACLFDLFSSRSGSNGR